MPLSLHQKLVLLILSNAKFIREVDNGEIIIIEE